jgi:serine/threonine protein kinase
MRDLKLVLKFTLNRSQANESVVVKGVEGHPRVENERDVIKRFQHRSPYLRPLLDEIEEPSDPAIIVLKHLDSHLLTESIQKALTRNEIKYVSKRILEALKVLHDDGYVHTGNIISNLLPNTY